MNKYFTNVINLSEHFKARGLVNVLSNPIHTRLNILPLKNIRILKVILLLCENYFLRNALSNLRARSTGIYHHQDNNEGQTFRFIQTESGYTCAKNKKMDDIVRQNKKPAATLLHDMDYIKVRYRRFCRNEEI